jgi:hypothetical protein
MHLLRPALSAFALVLALGAPAAAAVTVTVEPDDPTWRDPIVAVVHGTGCLAAGAPTITQGTPTTIDFDVTSSCPGQSTATELRVPIGRLGAGQALVRAHDLSTGQVPIQFFLVHDVYQVTLELPPLATDAGEVTVLLGAFTTCFLLDTPRLEGDTITIAYSPVCIIPYPYTPHVSYAPIKLGILPAGTYRVRVTSDFGFYTPDRASLYETTLRVWHAGGCLPSDTTLCLQDGRFAVRASWRDFAGRTGAAHAAPLPAGEQTGLLWFFAPDNGELTVQVLDGCAANQHWWAFVSSSSTVEYDVEVTDTRTGTVRSFHNALGAVPALLADTDAFDCP